LLDNLGSRQREQVRIDADARNFPDEDAAQGFIELDHMGFPALQVEGDLPDSRGGNQLGWKLVPAGELDLIDPRRHGTRGDPHVMYLIPSRYRDYKLRGFMIGQLGIRALDAEYDVQGVNVSNTRAHGARVYAVCRIVHHRNNRRTRHPGRTDLC